MTKENRQRLHRKTVRSLPVLLSAVFLKAEVRLSRPPQVPGRRAGFPARWIPPYGKIVASRVVCRRSCSKTARYIHNACDKNIPDLGQRLPCPRARPDRPVSDRDISLMTPRTKRSIDRNEQCLRVAGMDVRNPVR